MKPYILECQNEECMHDIEVEITYFNPGHPGVWANAWEDSSPPEPAEVEYNLTPCPVCKTVQKDTKKLYEEILEYAIDRADDFDDDFADDYDDEC